MTNAYVDGIGRLYHYEKFCPEYLIALLRDQRVHCSNPANFNDPWDCRPSFDTSSLQDPGQRIGALERLKSEEVTARIFEKAKLQGPGITEDDPGFVQRLFDGLSIQMAEIAAERWGIYCLTPYADSTLMWSHYANNHRGICLEFATDNNRLFASALKVTYQSDYPRWTPYITDIEPDILLTKSSDWAYESEYRIIARKQESELDNLDEGLLLARGGFLKLPPGALVSVIAGCESDYSAIRTIVADSAVGLTTKRAVRSANHYRLQIEP